MNKNSKTYNPDRQFLKDWEQNLSVSQLAHRDHPFLDAEQRRIS